MSTPTEGDKLRMRMRRIRGRMHTKVDGLLDDASQLLDWRYYFRQYPWVGVGAAAMVGFWLMPGRRVTPTVKLSDSSIDELIKRGGLRVETPTPKAKTTMLATVSALVLPIISRVAMGYVNQQLAAVLPSSSPEQSRPGRESYV